jgi:hypothetical protein
MPNGEALSASALDPKSPPFAGDLRGAVVEACIEGDGPWEQWARDLLMAVIILETRQVSDAND